MATNYNYDSLMAKKPTIYGKITNSLGQEIEFLEHPIHGDGYPVICACHKLNKAADSGFFDTEDMEMEDGDYEPSFQDGEFYIGDFIS